MASEACSRAGCGQKVLALLIVKWVQQALHLLGHGGGKQRQFVPAAKQGHRT
jgi:hypothetical protein